MKVTALVIYPVKSCSGINVESAKVTECGLEFDRMWVVAEYKKDGWAIVTQRELPSMVHIIPRVDTTNGIVLELSAPKMPALRVPLMLEETPVPIIVWKSPTMGVDQGQVASDWFSKYLGRPVTLFAKSPIQRALKLKHTPSLSLFTHTPQTAFADGFPFLIISEPSINAFQSQTARSELSYRRFRPNILISGCNPYEEDEFMVIVVGNTRFYISSRCTRCVMPNTDPVTAQLDPTLFKDLMKTRRVDAGAKYEPCMGVNAINQSAGDILRVGDSVVVESRGLHDRRGVWNHGEVPVPFVAS